MLKVLMTMGRAHLITTVIVLICFLILFIIYLWNDRNGNLD